MDLQDEVINPNHNPILFAKDKFLRSKYQVYLRKALPLLLSVSLISLFLFFTGISFFHSYTCYVSTFLLPFIAHTLERKYLFLLCNGIVIFLARNSGMSGSLPSAALQTEELSETDDVIHQKNVDVAEEDVDMLQHERTEPVNAVYAAGVEDELAETQEEEEEDADLEEEKKKESGVIVKEEEEEDEGGSEGPSSNTEELNKKIEEFIRKMKEELKLEAQQQQPIAA